MGENSKKAIARPNTPSYLTTGGPIMGQKRIWPQSADENERVPIFFVSFSMQGHVKLGFNRYFGLVPSLSRETNKVVLVQLAHANTCCAVVFLPIFSFGEQLNKWAHPVTRKCIL